MYKSVGPESSRSTDTTTYSCTNGLICSLTITGNFMNNSDTIAALAPPTAQRLLGVTGPVTCGVDAVEFAAGITPNPITARPSVSTRTKVFSTTNMTVPISGVFTLCYCRVTSRR